MSSRNDYTLTPNKNGEYWLQEKLIESLPESHEQVFFDIGANIGEWTDSLFNISRNYNKKCFVHLFEPSTETCTYLKKHYHQNNKVKLNQFALSDETKKTTLYLHDSLSAVNSLYRNDNLGTEEVSAIRLDDYIKAEKITHIDFIKSDTEGHDLKVMYGAEKSLMDGIIDIWQFEYNSKWIKSRSYLKDVFDFIGGTSYCVAKISKHGIEVYDSWNPELDRFFESNYLLVRKDNVLLQNLARHVVFDKYNVLVEKNSR